MGLTRHRYAESVIRNPDPLLYPVRLERIRRVQEPRIVTPETKKARMVLSILAAAVFLTGLFFVIF